MKGYKQRWILLFLVSLTAMAPASAQVAAQLETALMSRGRTGFRTCRDGAVNHGKKGAAALQRVIGESNYYVNNNSRVYYDSVVYKYSGSRSSVFNTHSMQYQTQYPRAGVPGVHANPGIIDVQADSVIYYNIGGRSSYKKYAYSADGLLLSYEVKPGVGTVFYDGMKIVIVYNAAGQIIEDWRYGWNRNNARWDTVKHMTCYYDASGLITSDTVYQYLGAWRIEDVASYHYNAQGKLQREIFYNNQNGTLVPMFRATNTYDVQDRVVSVAYEYILTAGLALAEKDEFDYTGTSRDFSRWTNFARVDTQWVASSKWEKHVNSQALTDTTFVYSWDRIAAAWQLSTIKVYEYNSFDNPVICRSFLQGNFTSADVRYYYYELYNEPASVPVYQKGDLVIFPNPATEQLRIDIPYSVTGPVIIQVLDAAGKVLLKQYFQNPQGSVMLPVAAFQPGLYLITMNAAEGIWQSRFLKE